MTNPQVSVETLAKLFKLSTRRIQQLAKQGVIPRAGHGQYDLVEAIQGYIDYLQAKIPSHAYRTSDVQTEKARLTKLQADKVQLELEQLKKTLIPMNDVVSAMSALVQSTKQRLLGVAKRLTPELLHQTEYDTVETLLEQAIHQALALLSEDDFNDALNPNDAS